MKLNLSDILATLFEWFATITTFGIIITIGMIFIPLGRFFAPVKKRTIQLNLFRSKGSNWKYWYQIPKHKRT